jgi:hypothetical protein
MSASNDANHLLARKTFMVYKSVLSRIMMELVCGLFIVCHHFLVIFNQLEMDFI